MTDKPEISKLEVMKFDEGFLFTARINGEICIDMRSVIRSMGFEWGHYSQALLQEKCYAMTITNPLANNKKTNTLFMPLDHFKDWLLKINPDQVNLKVRSRVLYFRNNCIFRLEGFWAKLDKKKEVAYV